MTRGGGAGVPAGARLPLALAAATAVLLAGCAEKAAEAIEGTGVHIVGVTLTKSVEESSQYGYRLYQYGGIDHKRGDVIMISKQSKAS